MVSLFKGCIKILKSNTSNLTNKCFISKCKLNLLKGLLHLKDMVERSI